MTPELRDRLATILERPHRLGMIGGELHRQLDHCEGFLAVVDGILGEHGASGTVDTAEVADSADSADEASGAAVARTDGPVGRWGLDLGTGGGIPGLALAVARPELYWALLDSRTSRAAEVERCVARAGIHDRVQVLAIQAQQAAHEPQWRHQFDIVVARSFGPPSFTAECASGFLRSGGSLVVSEPPEESTSSHPPRWDTDALALCGFAEPIWHSSHGARFVELRRTAAARAELPRLPPRKDRGWPSP